MNQIEFVDTDKDVHFTGALIQNAIEVESIDFPSNWGTVGINECTIEGISIQSDQNLEWDVYIFSTSGHSDTDLDLDTFVDKFNWATTTADRIAGAGQYYYPSPDNNMRVVYYDKKAMARENSLFQSLVLEKTKLQKLIRDILISLLFLDIFS